MYYTYDEFNGKWANKSVCGSRTQSRDKQNQHFMNFLHEIFFWVNQRLRHKTEDGMYVICMPKGASKALKTSLKSHPVLAVEIQ